MMSTSPTQSDTSVLCDSGDAGAADLKLQQLQKLVRATSHILSNIAVTTPTSNLFDDLLAVLLDLTDSEYGFIGEILITNDGQPYLKTRAITDISWNDETQSFYEKYAPEGLEFFNLKSLWGAAVTTGQAVISNSPSTDARRSGLPPGHPALTAFMGLPFRSNGELIGMVGLANRPDGYNPEIAGFLEPLLHACAAVIESRRNDRWRKQNEAVLESATEIAIISTDKEGVVQTFNRGAENLLGYSAKEVVGKENPLLWHDEKEVRLRAEELRLLYGKEMSSFDVLIANPMITGVEERHWTFIRKDGVHRNVKLTVTCIKHFGEDVTGYLAIAKDITEQLEIEAELRQKSKALELQASELAEAFDRAESACRAKSEFLANMSHEIRTPMAAILGFNEIILENATKPEDIDAAETVKQNGEYLINLINDILDLSKIEAGKIEMEQIDCSAHEIVADVASLMRMRATAKGLSLDVRFDGPLPEKIQSDPTRLRQILINIVSNAIKFTETGSIEIVTRLLNESGKEPNLQFDVIDPGIGIAAEQIENIFKPFTQADGSMARQYGGTGLGLSISKRLVDALGGKISVSSTLGQGSTFSFTVSTGPLDNLRLIHNVAKTADETVEAYLADEPQCSLRNYRILLVEDGPDNQRLIGFILKKAGAEVTLADDGQSGFDVATTAMSGGHAFDVILMDMQMPVMDGYAATRRLRNDGYSGPIIALTAHAMSFDRQKCLDAGCDDYTTQPIDQKKLIDMVARYAKKVEVVAAASPESSEVVLRLPLKKVNRQGRQVKQEEPRMDTDQHG